MPPDSERFQRHLVLPDFGPAGQRRLAQARVLVVGLGGLGCPVALYLASSGVGTLHLADYDRVEESNLARQIAHCPADVGALKTDSVARKIAAQSPSTVVHCLPQALGAAECLNLAGELDLIVDCCDNAESRFELNDASQKSRLPLVTAAAIRWHGQITAFDPQLAHSPCYQCLYPHRDDVPDVSCEREGIAAPVVGVLGTMQALTALHMLLGRRQLVGKLLLFDGASMDWQQINLPKAKGCPACG